MDWIEGLQTAIEYMENHLLEPMETETIARCAYSSAFHFQRVFRTLTGLSVGEYIRKRRLSLAAAELIETDTKVIDVAIKYGYETSESFAKAFARFHGMSPSAARESGVIYRNFDRLTVRVAVEGGEHTNDRNNGGQSMKRAGYLSWDEYFMGVALLSAERSKDPGTQVGACIVSGDNKILSVGYNGMPTGCCDDSMPWERAGDALETKYLFVCHAELNAILNHGGTNLQGARLYSTLFPCNECAKAIIQSGIREVVYLSDKYADTDSVVASKHMFEMTGIQCRAYTMGNKSVELKL